MALVLAFIGSSHAQTIYNNNDALKNVAQSNVYFDVSLGQCRDPALACVLAALVRVHCLWLAVSGDCLLQCFDTKAGIQRI